MAVSKRTRYEVLKRDNHTCRYCGATAPDAVLTVDHVTPVALGGSDDPSNLVAACKDCNAGKASTSPDAALVEDVRQIDLLYADAIRRVAATRAKEQKKVVSYIKRFRKAWENWTYGSGQWTFDLPANWQGSIARFYELGVPIEELEALTNVACGNDKIKADATFRYFAGCVWKTVAKMQEDAKALLAAQAPNVVADDEAMTMANPRYAYGCGWWAGNINAALVAARLDPVSAVVDHIAFSETPGSESYKGTFYWNGVHPLDRYDELVVADGS